MNFFFYNILWTALERNVNDISEAVISRSVAIGYCNQEN